MDSETRRRAVAARFMARAKAHPVNYLPPDHTKEYWCITCGLPQRNVRICDDTTCSLCGNVGVYTIDEMRTNGMAHYVELQQEPE